VAILREPAYRGALSHGVAASVEHEAIPLRREFRTVIDARANRGRFAVFAARRFPPAALICFEPLPGRGRLVFAAISSVKAKAGGTIATRVTTVGRCIPFL
jgi:hypothetical protein